MGPAASLGIKFSGLFLQMFPFEVAIPIYIYIHIYMHSICFQDAFNVVQSTVAT